MKHNCASQQAPGGPEHHDEKPLPIPRACALRRRDIERLVGPYAYGQVVRGGQEDLFPMVLGLDPNRDNDAPSLVVLAWEIDLVRAEIACVVGPGFPAPVAAPRRNDGRIYNTGTPLGRTHGKRYVTPITRLGLR